jgi:histidinol dehydrogenase
MLAETERLLATSPRLALLKQSLENSFALVVETVKEAVAFSNDYAPEHLVLNVRDAHSYISQVTNAGSVFVGPYASVTVGDYASGTNHTLPTAGYAKAYSGVSLDSFVKQITFQELTQTGADGIGPTVVTLAEAEGLVGHAHAMSVRLSKKSS